MKETFYSAIILTSILLNSCNREDNKHISSTTTSETTTPLTPQPPTTSEKPKDSYIGIRGVAQNWKTTSNIYLEKIDIVELYNNPENLIPTLKELVTFVASEPEGAKFYILNDEDLKDLNIHNIEYNGKNISFYTSYKGIKSSIKSSLSFNDTDYYNKKITINNDYVSSHYMRGIYETLPIGIGNILNIDSNRYDIEITNKYKDDHQNNLSVSLQITDKRTNKISIINKDISGFKTLNQLANDLNLSHNLSFREIVKSKLKDNKTDYTNDLKGTFTNKWKEYLVIYLPNYEELISYGQDNVLRGPRGYLDIYLEHPKFTIQSAILDGNNMNIKIEFQQANDQHIGKEYNLVIANIK